MRKKAPLYKIYRKSCVSDSFLCCWWSENVCHPFAKPILNTDSHLGHAIQHVWFITQRWSNFEFLNSNSNEKCGSRNNPSDTHLSVNLQQNPQRWCLFSPKHMQTLTVHDFSYTFTSLWGALVLCKKRVGLISQKSYGLLILFSACWEANRHLKTCFHIYK